MSNHVWTGPCGALRKMYETPNQKFSASIPGCLLLVLLPTNSQGAVNK